jgi:hypothetical protein
MKDENVKANGWPTRNDDNVAKWNGSVSEENVVNQ